MQIYGIDFTSAPRRHKPLTCAAGWLEGGVLHVTGLESWTHMDAFEAFLNRPGPWVAGCDFPFGQPRVLVEALGWPPSWAGYVAALGRGDLETFMAQLKVFREARPPGHKHLLRRTDALAGAISPLMVRGVPVGRMFFRGAPRLLAAGVAVLPCHVTGADRVALETYPALAARRWGGGQPYKAESRARQTVNQTAVRRAILAGVQAEAPSVYGFALDLPVALVADLIADGQGDRLDALLALLPAAWAAARQASGWGIPALADPLEGWIVDPALVVPGVDFGL